MRVMRVSVLSVIGFLFALLVSGCSPQTSSDTLKDADAIYYLVRHAEKTTEKNDPGLTGVGVGRANDLAARLAGIKLDKIYSSNYIRTRDTAAATAKAQGVAVEIYDPKDLEGFAASLLSQTGHILVVGHSNTTPPLADLLGGKGGEPIVEASEYNRFYVLTRSGNDIVTDIQTFGK